MIKRVYVEITNRCNLQCPFCVPSQKTPREMSLEEVASILQQLPSLTPYVYLHIKGEPCSHSHFEAILDNCDRLKLQVQLVTNGSYLSTVNLSSHPSLRKLSVSAQSLDSQRTSVEDYYTSIHSSFASLDEAVYKEIRFWAKDSLQPKALALLERLQKDYSFEPTKRPDSFQLAKNTFVSFADTFRWPQVQDPKDVQGLCRGGLDMIGILSDGTVVPCCLDQDGLIPLGNAFITPLHSILESPRYQALVQGFQNHQCVESLCQACTYRHRFD